MGFEAWEESSQGAEPIELYHFARGITEYRFTSAKDAIEHDGYTWEPALLNRSAFDLGDDGARSAIKIQCVRDFPVAELFRVRPPDEVVLFTLHRLHANETTASIVVWMGRVLGAEWRGAIAEMACEPVSSAMTRPGLRRLYSRSCPHDLYGANCKANRNLFMATVTLTGVTVTASGTQIHSDELSYWASSPWFAGGYVEYTRPDGITERRQALSNADDYIVISAGIDGLAAGVEVRAYFGCDHTMGTCRIRFDNLANYGGFPFIPGKNPLSGSTIY